MKICMSCGRRDDPKPPELITRGFWKPLAKPWVFRWARLEV